MTLAYKRCNNQYKIKKNIRIYDVVFKANKYTHWVLEKQQNNTLVQSHLKIGYGKHKFSKQERHMASSNLNSSNYKDISINILNNQENTA